MALSRGGQASGGRPSKRLKKTDITPPPSSKALDEAVAEAERIELQSKAMLGDELGVKDVDVTQCREDYLKSLIVILKAEKPVAETLRDLLKKKEVKNVRPSFYMQLDALLEIYEFELQA